MRKNAGVEQSEKERDHDMPQNQPRKVTAKVGFGPPKCRDFIMDIVHKIPVPDESKREDKNPSCDEGEEEFFPVHNFDLLGCPKPPRT
ncbi:MAG: hypothetical protein DMF25_08220 [Verrucomicrobia bacterium]|nr:MAG: hypothetical protein DMF25_08220 [Verrucomicrobiota bacterium]